MKKPSYILALLIHVITFQLNAQSMAVGRSGIFNSVKEAIEMANAGDTVVVESGIYREGNIIIQKPIVLIGKDYPVLDGEMKYEVLTIAVPDVVVKGFHIINSGRSSMEDLAGVKCLDAHKVVIIDNIFENNFFTIHLSNTDDALIANNRLSATAEFEYQLGNGIHLWKCKRANINGNTITGHRDGIYFEFVTDAEISNNHSERNMRYGLHFMFSHDDIYKYNTFKNNGAGVSVMYTRNVTMHYNHFEQNWGPSSYGMLLKDIRDSDVRYNRFVGNTAGIYMEGTSRTTFMHNLFQENGWAVRLMASCDDNTFSGNNFMLNTFDIATNGDLVLNSLAGNYWDKYQGYDLNKDGVGDVPFHPVSMFSVIVERIPAAILLWRSFLVFLLDRVEKIMPVITPENLKDIEPQMLPYDLNS